MKNNKLGIVPENGEELNQTEERIILPKFDYPKLPEEPSDAGLICKTTVVLDGKGYVGVTERGALKGDTVAAVVAPAAGNKFKGWYEDGALVSTENPYVFTVTGNRAMMAKTTPLTEENKEIKTPSNHVREGYLLPYEDLSDPNLQATVLAGKSEYLNRSAILNEGNRALVAKVLEKAKRGEKITVASIGGSITQGALFNGKDRSFGKITSEWFEETFGIEVENINAGIGSTGSLVGVHRLETDVLSKNPDLLLLEFSVNDVSSFWSDQPYRETYEAIIRRVLKENIAIIGIIFGSTDAKRHDYPTHHMDTHTATLFYYDLPIINFYTAFWRYTSNKIIEHYDLDSNGKITEKSFTFDGGGHPSVAGHNIIGKVIAYYLQDILTKLENGKVYETEPYFPEKPLFKNTPFYENVRFYASTRYLNYKIGNPVFNYKDRFIPAIVHGNSDRLGTGWICVGGKGAIIFEIKGIRSLSLCMMHKTDVSGVYSITINGKTVRDHVNTCTLNNVLWPEYCRVFDTPQDVYVTIECHSGVVGFGPIGVGF